MTSCLTGRELEILDLVAHNCSTHEIATELWVSENTVRTHIRHIFDKLGVHSRHDAAHAYWRLTNETLVAERPALGASSPMVTSQGSMEVG